MSVQMVKSPRYTKGERTRERILDCAMELFSRSGFAAVSLRDIAAHANISHAGLLKHFDGKDELLIRVLDRREAVEAEIQATERGIGVVQVVMNMITRNMSAPGLVALYVKIAGEATAPDHPAHEHFRRRYRRIRAVVADALRRHIDSLPAGERRPFDPDLAAAELVALSDGIQTQWLLEPDVIDMRAILLDAFDRLGFDTTDARRSISPTISLEARSPQ